MNTFFPGPDWLSRQDDINRVLAQKRQVWLIIHRRDLATNFSPNMVQQIFTQMRLPEVINNDILVFQSITNPFPLPDDPTYTIHSQWENASQLIGFDKALSDNRLILTLFWENISPVNDYKIFVHLRSPDGENIVQADHIPLEHIPYDLRRLAAQDKALFRDQVIMSLPPEVDLTASRFIVGFYNPATGERVPVVNDQSGENGVWLEGGL
jgi:hypothetical protein